MSIPPILCGAIVVILIATLVLAAGWFTGIENVTVPQLITLSALWIIPGLFTALKVRDAGALHGLLAGLLGGLSIFLLPPIINSMETTPSFLSAVVADSQPLLFILAGWWGAFGGLIADIRRVIRARRAARGKRKSND